MENIDKKISHQIYYGWKLSDSLVKFILRARMNQLPCNQVIHMWNKDHDKCCTLCNHHCESIAHLMNSCRKFSDLYSRRHDRVVDAIHMRIVKLDPSWKVFTNKMAETIFPELREELRTICHRKPDLIMVNTGQKECKIIEVTVCFDMYMEQSYRG